MKQLFIHQFLAVLCLLIVSSCTHPEKQTQTTDSNNPPSIAQVRSLLSSELTIDQLKLELGNPDGKSDGGWGNIRYNLPSRKSLYFFFKGNHVTGARYDKTEIKGVTPKIYKIRIRYEMGDFGDPSTDQLTFTFEETRLSSIDDLKNKLKSLPKGSTVERLFSCCDIPPAPRTIIEDIEKFCSENGLILIHYPG